MIYIVEDDAEIRELEVYALKSSGFESKAFESGKPMDEEVKVKSTANKFNIKKAKFAKVLSTLYTDFTIKKGKWRAKARHKVP